MNDEFDDCFPVLGALAYRVGYRLLGDRGDAEEVAQETLARAYVRWRRVRHYAEAWVVRVATNLSLDRIRRRRFSAPAPFDATDQPANAISDIHIAERLDLARELDRLPRRQRQVVALRYLADLPEADVARTLGCSVGSVKRHAHRGLTALRQFRVEGTS